MAIISYCRRVAGERDARTSSNHPARKTPEGQAPGLDADLALTQQGVEGELRFGSRLGVAGSAPTVQQAHRCHPRAILPPAVDRPSLWPLTDCIVSLAHPPVRDQTAASKSPNSRLVADNLRRVWVGCTSTSVTVPRATPRGRSGKSRKPRLRWQPASAITSGRARRWPRCWTRLETCP